MLTDRSEALLDMSKALSRMCFLPSDCAAEALVSAVLAIKCGVR